MQPRRVRFVQIRPRSPWQWLLLMPLVLVALVLAFLLFLVALVAGLFAALFGGRRPRVSVERHDTRKGEGPKVIDAEYVIDEDDAQPSGRS